MKVLESTSAAAIILTGVLAGGGALAQSATNLVALRGLVPITTLLNNAQGQAALASNYSVTGGIQTGTLTQPTLLPFAQQQQQALRDAFITGGNATELADGLGTRLGGIYQSKAVYSSTNDGATSTFTSISPNVAALIGYANALSGADSQSGKYGFANATTNGTTPSATAAAIIAAAGGQTDVLGKAYGKPGGSAGADPYGDSRPFQTEPNVLLYTGKDYFGVASGNNVYLNGPTQNLTASPSFPSGHTTYGYTESLLLALMVPERFQEMVTRGAEYGNDRIILGAHYAVDVIAGRTLAMYDLAQELANNPTYVGQTLGGYTITNFQTSLTAATNDLRSTLQAGCGASIATCATQDTSRFANAAANKAFYESTQTYGLPVVYANNTGVENFATLAPEAGYLLQTRFPYLTLAQRDDVLTTTEGPGGGFLDNGSAFGAYSRIDLYRAADGYGAFNSQVMITMNAALGGFNAADSFNNDISGTGGLTLAGTGRLTLTGTDTYTGPTIVNGGTLQVTGSIVSATTVNAGGTLAGNGTVGAVTVNAGGALAPGGATQIGTLRVDGPIAFAPGSYYAIRATPKRADKTVVTGAATIGGGTVLVAAGGKFLPQSRYTILDAKGGRTGTFSDVETNLAFLTPSLSYGADKVFLTLDRNDLSFATVAQTSNQIHVAQALTNAATQTPVSAAGASILNGLYTASAPQARAAYDSLSGEGIAASQNADIRTSRAFSGSIADQAALWRSAGDPTPAPLFELADPATPHTISAQPYAPHYRFWGAAFGGDATINANASLGTAGQRFDVYGGQAGVDYEIAPNVLFGGAAGGSGSDFTVASRATGGRSTGVHGALYAVAGFGPSYIESSSAFSSFSNTTTRQAGGIGALPGATERASFGSNEFRERLEGGRVLAYDGIRVTPFVALEIARLASDGFTEYSANGTGNALALRNYGQTSADVPGFVGLRLASVYDMGGGMIFRPVVSAAYLHEFAPERNLTNTLVSLPGATFLVDGARPARNAAQVKAGGEVAVGRNVSLFANFDGEFSGVETFYGGKGGVRIVW